LFDFILNRIVAANTDIKLLFFSFYYFLP